MEKILEAINRHAPILSYDDIITLSHDLAIERAKNKTIGILSSLKDDEISEFILFVLNKRDNHKSLVTEEQSISQEDSNGNRDKKTGQKAKRSS